VLLTLVLAAVGYWVGGALGAGIGAVAGGFTPLLIERATRRQEAIEAGQSVVAPAPRYGPAHLLDPGLGVVPFIGRDAELAVLEGWCLDGSAGLVRLVSGAGGSGKTRLALELMRRMGARGWACALVAEGAEDDIVQVQRSATPGAKMLLVVDYSETRPRLERLLKAAARDEGPVRVLLLARQAGDWWDRLQGGESIVRDLVRDAGAFTVKLGGNLDPKVPSAEVIRKAVPCFAAKLGIAAPGVDQVVIENEGGMRVLDLHAAALVAVLSADGEPAKGQVQVDAKTVLEELLGHEIHYWRGQAEAMGLLGGRDGLSMAQLSQVAAAGCLLGASSAAELDRRVPGVTVTEAVARWLRELYPPEHGDELGVLRPDRLAELHVTRELSASQALADACLTGLDVAQARHALTVLARASAEQPTARPLLESTLARFTDVIDGMTAPRDVMIAIADAIPYPSLAMARAHASISREILATYPPGTADHARWLNILTMLLGDLGKWDEALAAIKEAVATYRALPKTFLADLATSLSNASNCLSELGQREEALAAIKEAVAIQRTLADARPVAFLPDLAMSRSNESNCLSRLGRPEEALTAAEEAVIIRRALADARPDAFLPDLATSLNNYSNRLSDMGRRDDALAAAGEAVATFRALAEARPDGFLPDLAMALNNQAGCLSDLGRPEEALTAIEEAIAIRRALADARPDAFLPDLATSLSNQAIFLFLTERLEEALTAIEEAIAIRRPLANARPDELLPALAESLNNQTACLMALMRREEALAAIGEALAIYQALAEALPSAFTARYADLLDNQALTLGILGREAESPSRTRPGSHYP
jgi:tetratricopeptide (TPR) repeat protein